MYIKFWIGILSRVGILCIEFNHEVYVPRGLALALLRVCWIFCEYISDKLSISRYVFIQKKAWLKQSLDNVFFILTLIVALSTTLYLSFIFYHVLQLYPWIIQSRLVFYINFVPSPNQVGDLKHNGQLSELAQRWAEHLAATSVLKHSNDSFRGEQLGENVATKWGSAGADYNGMWWG